MMTSLVDTAHVFQGGWSRCGLYLTWVAQDFLFQEIGTKATRALTECLSIKT